MNSKIAILDDHQIFRSGLIHLIEGLSDYKILLDTDDPELLFSFDKLHEINILILDISLPKLSGFSVIEKLKELDFCGKIIILSMFDEKEYGFQSIRQGASAYLTKSIVADELVDCLNTVKQGRLYISSLLSKMFSMGVKQGFDEPPHILLSDREREVLLYLAKGLRPVDISKELFLSIKTISAYKTKIFSRLNLSNQSDLVLYCIKYGILTIPKRV